MNIRCFFQTRLSAILFNKRIVQPSICFETRGRVFQAFGRAFKADLGFTIVNNIAFSDHISNICKTANKKLDFERLVLFRYGVT